MKQRPIVIDGTIMRAALRAPKRPAWQAKVVTPDWRVQLYTYVRNKAIRWGWRVVVRGKQIAHMTGFASEDQAKLNLMTLVLVGSEWRRQAKKRDRLAKQVNDERSGGAAATWS